MKRFQRLFADKKSKHLMPFFMLGDPNLDSSFTFIQAAIDAGAAALELGIPFSDPMADGPLLQRSAERALASGATFSACLALVAKIRDYTEIPITVMLYYNLLLRRGLDEAHRQCAAAGVDAVLVVDLPLEESSFHEQSLQQHNLGAIQFIAPNTSDERAATLLTHSTAFTYVLNDFGVTGIRSQIPMVTLARLPKLDELNSDKPLVVGFGVSSAEQVHALHQAGAKGVIIASVLTQMIEQHLGQDDVIKNNIKNFISDILK